MQHIISAAKNWVAGFKAMADDNVEFDSDEGASLVEYILLVVGIALIAFAALRLIGPAIRDRFNETENEIRSN